MAHENISSCHWIPSPSIKKIVSDYVNLFNDYYFNEKYNHCSGSAFVHFNFDEYILIIIFCVIIYLCKKIFGRYLQSWSRKNYPGITIEKEKKFIIYSIAFVERIIFILINGYILTFLDDCPGLWNVNKFLELEYSKTVFICLLLANSRSLVHLLELLSHPFHRWDTQILFIHHMVTIILLLTLAQNQIYYSLWVLLIHDICDPFLEFAKILKYLYDSPKANKKLFSTIQWSMVFFLAFSFLIFRLYIFLYRLISALPFMFHYFCKPSVAIYGVMLFSILFFMHLTWFCLALKCLFYMITTGTIIDFTNNKNRNLLQYSQTDTKSN